MPVRLRHKIEKKVNAKAKKERRNAKRHPEQHRKKKPEQLNIPNSYPYKDQLLAEIEENKRKKEEERVRRIEAAKAKRQEAAQNNVGMEVEEDEVDEDSMDEESDDDMMDEDDGPATGNSAMAALLASAKARAEEYEMAADDSDAETEDDYGNQIGDDTTQSSTRKETSRKTFDKMFKTVLDAADVILYVLDARDPNGTRSKAVERQVMAAQGGEKRLILILNKIDLVPPHVLKGWMVYLKRYFPTIPLKAANSAPNSNTFDHKALTTTGTSTTLLKALKSYANSKQLKRSVSVGVIGYPNVGKSSVINALTGRLGGSMSACPTGAEAGVTTSLREIKLDKKLKLIDSPGIVFPGEGGQKKTKDEAARLILVNAVPPKQILDPVPAVTLLLKRLSTSQQLLEKMFNLYGIPPLVTTSPDLTNDFLIQVARKRGRLGKGGVPNSNSAAFCVINDWRDGRIQGWVDPPEIVPTVGALDAQAQQGIKMVDVEPVIADQKEIVTEWAAEFKLEGLWGNGETGVEDEDVEM